MIIQGHGGEGKRTKLSLIPDVVPRGAGRSKIKKAIRNQCVIIRYPLSSPLLDVGEGEFPGSAFLLRIGGYGLSVHYMPVSSTVCLFIHFIMLYDVGAGIKARRTDLLISHLVR